MRVHIWQCHDWSCPLNEKNNGFCEEKVFDLFCRRTTQSKRWTSVSARQSAVIAHFGFAWICMHQNLKCIETYRTQRGSGVAAQQVLCQNEFFSDRTSADSFSVLAKQDVWALSFVVARRKPLRVLSLARTTLIFVHYFYLSGNFHESHCIQIWSHTLSTH